MQRPKITVHCFFFALLFIDFFLIYMKFCIVFTCVHVGVCRWEGCSRGTQLITPNYIKLVSFGTSIIDWTSSHDRCRNLHKPTHVKNKTHSQSHYLRLFFLY